MSAERLVKWEVEFAALKEERDALALEFDEDYPAAVSKLVDLLTRVSAFDAKLSRLHQSRPSGVALHLDAPELLARGLEAFSRATPSLLRLVQLFDRNGKQCWPPVQKRDLSLFDPQRFADPRASADWWRFAEQNAAYAKAQSELVSRYYENQAKERDERERNQ
jgi:hypothetical protein